MSETPRSGMADHDEITTTESLNPRRKNATVVTEDAGAVRTVNTASTSRSDPVDVSAIEASVANIREKALALPNSDELAAVLLAVESIERALPVIAQGLADITASLAEVKE